ncbi:VWA domain-containing protein BatB [Leptospira interrogans]|uniref:von Willebrand factor type A domain protein n=2 Tax=Leptospira interrogans TaxID=173 RepID=A0A0F6IA98_LEPIR|nr:MULTISPECIES: VWA domain-containing protein [Leptospira]AJR16251.1 von Willebrand factor type A domain-containing protein [Leptospira interrogans serovar Linhai str. 56609]EKO86884.1 von Willebrand factor type A domain protein [Leptospira interrogans serovar Grippotyphosa str. Andaman]EMF33583.1 von Willebrand factor type A domain protein [Leptospira interrogans serovar Pomona str. Fox 32256]EMJ34973.1 von Willebrand factor type A domain protein [Leptospira interrogans str. FPW1039]KGE21479
MNQEFSANLKNIFFALVIVWIIYSTIRIFLISKIREWKIFYPGIERSSSFPDVRWVLVRILLIFAVLVCVFFAGLKTEMKDEKKEESFKGVDILFLVDVSLSMQAIDSSPTRLAKFKEVLLRMLPSLSGNRFGMIVFAGSPFLYCPMTTDVSAFSDYVRGLDVDMVGDRGTDLSQAFTKAEALLRSEKVFRNRILILVTDGEDQNDPQAISFPASFQVWAAGTENGGPIVYNDENSGLNGFLLKDGTLTSNPNSPGIIHSKMNRTFLKNLADKNDGNFYSLDSNPPDSTILQKEIFSLEENLYSRKKDLKRAEGSGKFLFAAVFLLLLDWILVESLLFPKRKSVSVI